MYITDIKNHLEEARTVLDQFLSNEENLRNIDNAAKLISESIQSGGKVFSCGNGGSHCDAMHFAEEMTGNFRDQRKALPAIAISDPSHISCVSNDFGFESIFARYVEGLGVKGDVLLAISCSGNSANVVNATEVAKSKGMKVISLTGKDGGKLGMKADVDINVPFHGYADRIQEIHIKIIHILIFLIEKYLKLHP